MATYYIDYKNGNDTTGNGSSGTPYKTLTKALTVVGNNDTILARGSDAADEIYYEYSMSTARTGLTIGADTGHTPTWTPAVKHTSWTLTDGRSNTYEAAYTPAGIYYAWNGATQLTLVANVDAVEATANTYYADVAGDKLYVHITGGGAPTTIHSAFSVSGLLTSAGTGIAYSGLRAQWCGLGFYFNTAGTATNCAVRYHGGAALGNRYGFRVDAAVEVTCTGCSVTGQYGTSTGTVAFAVTSAGGTLTADTCTVSGARYGVFHTTNATITVVSSTFDYCYDAITFANQTITGNVSYCTFYDFSHGAVQYSGANVTGTAHHNVAYALASPRIDPVNAYIVEAAAQVSLYHNVAAGMSAASGNGIGFTIQSTAVATLKNNIAFNCKRGFNRSDTGGAPTITSDYNNAHSCSVFNYSSYPAWPAGEHDLEADPLFTDAAGYDFTLTALSPMIDAGVVIAGINDGYSGAAPDIGRWEYSLLSGAPRQLMHYARMRTL